MADPAPRSMPDPARPSVFLSYASEDRPAARQLRDALSGYGLDVWYDESELGGGDAWDQKIRRQIRDCDYFMPLVSAQTERRLEGYFRREWRIAVERTLDMADDHLFLLPIVIDETHQAGARVPERFLTVQWLKVPEGRPTPALEAMCRRLKGGSGPVGSATPAAGAGAAAAGVRPAQAARAAVLPGTAPVFPVEVPGEKVRFWFEVAGWLAHSAWQQFKRLPRWVRILAYIWLIATLVPRCEESSHHSAAADSTPAKDDITPAKVAKLKAIAQAYEGSHDTHADAAGTHEIHDAHDLAKLGAAIAKEFGSDDDDDDAAASPLVAIAFTAPPGDAAGAKLADSTFAMTYGMIEISHHGQVGLTKEPLPTEDLASALARGKAMHAAYVLYGGVDQADTRRALNVKIAKVADGSVTWSKTYPAAGADPGKIARDIESNLPALKEPSG
jgi:hypothetical protein